VIGDSHICDLRFVIAGALGIASFQSTIASQQSQIINRQSQITNYKSQITNHTSPMPRFAVVRVA
jgi:hypothetical protein